MIKNIVIILTLSVSMHAMEQLSTDKITIKDLQHKHKLLKEELKSKPHYMLMWDPNIDGFHSIYQAKNSSDLTTIIQHCNPSMRIKENYSIIGVIAMAPNISLSDKEKFIQDLHNRGFEATPEDKELAIVEAEKRKTKSLL